MIRTGIVCLAALGCGPGDATTPGTPGATAAPPTAPDAPTGAPLLREVTTELGVDFVHDASLKGAYRISEMLGSGCAVFDADGDGRPDLYFVNAGDGPGSGAGNRFFRQGEDGRFTDATAESGLGDEGFGIGVAVADIDNDGDEDVFLANWGANTLLRNDGGRFTDVTKAAGVRGEHLSACAVFFDADADGHLDLYVVNYVVPDPLMVCGGPGRARDYCGPKSYRPVADQLYRNRGDGTFEDVSVASGVADRAGPGLSAVAEDFDGDGWIDVYVANDGAANFLWINGKDGTFREEGLRMGVAFNAQGAPEASMGIALGDADGDGERDLFLSHLGGETNTLYRRTGPGTFLDASARTGLATSSVDYTGWGTAFVDLEHDGDADLLVVNGSTVRRQAPFPNSLRPELAPYAEPNHLYLNDGGRLRRDDVAGGSYAAEIETTRALAAVDLDGDGDLDFVVTNVGGPARVYENVAPKRGNWLQVRAVDAALGRDVAGARVEIEAGGRRFTGVVGGGGSYVTSGPTTLHFGLGAVTGIDRAVVTWPGGKRETFEVDGVDRVVTLTRGAD